MARVQLIGLPHALAVLAKLDDVLQDRVLKVQEQSASAIAIDASRRVSVREGDLRRAISWRASKRSVSVGITKVHIPRRGHYGKSTAHEYPHIYGVWLEKGRVHQRARPFMRPAVEAEKQRYPGRLREAATMIGRDLSK